MCIRARREFVWKPTASAVNPQLWCLCICTRGVCVCVCRCSRVMYVRLAESSRYQVGLITKVIPPEQQLRNGRR